MNRKLQGVPLLREEALRVFRTWAESTDKVTY